MFSAGNDLSIVTWYPPRETGAPSPSAQVSSSSPSPPTPHEDDDQERRRRHDSGSTDAPSPDPYPPASPAAAVAPAPTNDEAMSGKVEHGGNTQTAVAHDSDPGVVVHLAEVVGLAVVPGALISADMAGRLLERGPRRLIGELSCHPLRGDWLCTTGWDAGAHRCRMNNTHRRR